MACAPDREAQGSVPPPEDPVRDQHRQELHGARGSLPHLHAAHDGLRQGVRLRGTEAVCPERSAVQIRLVHQVPDRHGTYGDDG